MMNFVKIELRNILDIRALSEVARYTKRSDGFDFSTFRVCFCSAIGWKTGQVILMDYFIPANLECVKLKIGVVLSEFVDEKNGYFIGGRIIEVEEGKEGKLLATIFKDIKNKEQHG
mgnify:CR=1 FL=1